MVHAGVYASLIFAGLSLAYGILMAVYLNDAKKCDNVLPEKESRFRKTALVITWIQVSIMIVSIITLVIQILSQEPFTIGQTLQAGGFPKLD